MVWGLRFLFLNALAYKTPRLKRLTDSLCIFNVRFKFLLFSDFRETISAVLNKRLSICKIFFAAARIFSLMVSDNFFLNFNESINCSCTLNHQCLNLFVADGLWRSHMTIYMKRRGFWHVEWGWSWQKSWEHRGWQMDWMLIR